MQLSTRALPPAPPPLAAPTHPIAATLQFACYPPLCFTQQGALSAATDSPQPLLYLPPADEPPVLLHAPAQRNLLPLLGAHRAGELQLGQVVLHLRSAAQRAVVAVNRAVKQLYRAGRARLGARAEYCGGGLAGLATPLRSARHPRQAAG